jgi:hypothetical protein
MTHLQSPSANWSGLETDIATFMDVLDSKAFSLESFISVDIVAKIHCPKPKLGLGRLFNEAGAFILAVLFQNPAQNPTSSSSRGPETLQIPT